MENQSTQEQDVSIEDWGQSFTLQKETTKVLMHNGITNVKC